MQGDFLHPIAQAGATHHHGRFHLGRESVVSGARIAKPVSFNPASPGGDGPAGGVIGGLRGPKGFYGCVQGALSVLQQWDMA